MYSSKNYTDFELYKTQRFKTSNKGFTLIDVGICIIITSILVLIFFMNVDINTQLMKSRDTKRKNDLFEIRNALDTYYNDFGCYPKSIPIGSEWKVNEMVYMKKVPGGGLCDNGVCLLEYIYMSNGGSSCSQCYLLMAGKEYVKGAYKDNDCESAGDLKACFPADAMINDKICYFGGSDCNCFASLVLQPSPTPTLVPTAVPTPYCEYYACTGSPSTCNSYSRLNNCTFNGGPVQCYCSPPSCWGNECCNNQCSR